MSKAGWVRLTEQLLSQADRDVVLTFEQIEQITGEPLPPTAHRHAAFWSNSSSYAHAWKKAGYDVTRRELPPNTIRFVRVRQVASEPSTTAAPATAPAVMPADGGPVADRDCRMIDCFSCGATFERTPVGACPRCGSRDTSTASSAASVSAATSGGRSGAGRLCRTHEQRVVRAARRASVTRGDWSVWAMAVPKRCGRAYKQGLAAQESRRSAMSVATVGARSALATIALVTLSACFFDGPGVAGVAEGPADSEIREILGADLAGQLVPYGTAGALNSADCSVVGGIARGEPREEYVDTLAETKMTFPVQAASVCVGERVTGVVEEVERRTMGGWTYLFYRDQFDQWAWKAVSNTP